MSRPAILACFASALLLAGPASAEEVKGKVKSVDPEKGTMVLAVGEAERAFAVPIEAKVFGLVGKKLKSQDVEGGLKGVKVGAEVTLATEVKEGAEAVKSVQVEGLAKVKKAKKAKKSKKAKTIDN